MELLVLLIFLIDLSECQWRSSVTFQNNEPSTSGVRIRRFRVPRIVAFEKDVKLDCDYEVMGNALYSLKWYKGESQFYAFIPNKLNKHAMFSVRGLREEQVQAGNEGRSITLRRVGIDASDQYRCELVAEGPPFHTVVKQSNMTVVVLPDGPPVLAGDRPSYHPDDIIVLNCTPPLAKPAASVHWYINSQPKSYARAQLVSHNVNPAGLESVTSELTLRVRDAVFFNGKLKIACEATLDILYKETTHLTVLEPTNYWFLSNNLYLTSGAQSVLLVLHKNIYLLLHIIFILTWLNV